MRKRRLVILVAAITALAVAAAIAVRLLLDPERHRDALERLARDKLGRDVALGDMGVSFLPRLSVTVDDVVVGPRDGERSDLVDIGSVRLGARLGPLLGGALEVDSVTIVAPRVNVEQLADGSWSVTRIGRDRNLDRDGDEPAEAEPPPAADGGLQISIDRVAIEDGTIDLAFGGRELALTPLDLSIEEPSSDRPLPFTLTTGLSELPGATIEAAGTVGPLAGGADGEPLAVDLELTLRDVDSAALGRLLGRPLPLATGAALNAAVRLDLALERPAGNIALDQIELDFDGRKLGLSGRVERDDAGRVLDLTIAPAALATADLTALAQVFGAPMTLDSPQPVELSGTLTGPVGDGRKPVFDGQVKVRELTVAHPSMRKPVEQLAAGIAVAGDRIEVEELALRIGGSDFAGQATVERAATTRVGFALRSQNVDFAELTSLVVRDGGGDKPAQGGAPKPKAAGGPRPEAEGSIRVGRGSFDQIKFQDLDATMRLKGGKFVLQPVTMQLYEGSFTGSVTKQLDRQPGRFELSGNVDEVAIGPLLEDAIGREPLLSGTLTGELQALATGEDYEQVVRSLRGTGKVKVLDGRTRLFNVAKTLSGVAGVFGGDTLAASADLVNTAGTVFERLQGDIDIKDGKATVKSLLLDSPALDLDGEVAVDLVDKTLDGSFTAMFSEAISKAMRVEGSRAGELFWDDGSKRVRLPFALSGSVGAPSATVDWKGAAAGLVQREVKQRLGEQASGALSSLLGGGSSGSGAGDAGAAEGTPQEPQPAAGGAPVAAGDVPVARAHGLEVSIERSKWKGFVLKNLEVEGTVRGAGLDHLEVQVSDANGLRLQKIGNVGEVGAGADPQPWKVKLDGKRLTVGAAPFTVEAVAVDGAGKKAVARKTVTR